MLSSTQRTGGKEGEVKETAGEGGGETEEKEHKSGFAKDLQKKAHIWSEGPESGGGWSQVRIKEDEERLKKRRRVNFADSSVVYSPRGHYSPYMVT